MTKKLIAGIAVMLTLHAYSQTPVANRPVPAEGAGAEGSARNLATAAVSRFNSEMNLSAEQKQKMMVIISLYLDAKAKLLPLMDENRQQYNDKQASYFKTLRIKLKEVLVHAQMEKFMLLKPRRGDIDSTLYYLYY